MRKSYLDFVNERNENIKNKKLIVEAFQKKNTDKVISLVNSLLKKHIDNMKFVKPYVN